MAMLPASLSNIGAECSVLSAAVYREDWLLEMLDRTSVDDYTGIDTRAVFSVIKQMHLYGEEVTLSTLSLHMHDLEEAGYVRERDMTFTELVGNPPMPSEFTGYINTIREMTQRRNAFRMAQMVQQMIQRGEMSDVVNAEIDKFVMAQTSTDMTREMMSPKDMANEIKAAVLERMDADARKKRVIYTTFGCLNQRCGGFEKGDLIILSAETGAGKSAFAMNLAKGIAIVMKRPLLYLNSEMSKNQFAIRWSSFLSGVSHSGIRNGSVSMEDAQKAIDTGTLMCKSALWTLNMPDMQIAPVLAEIRKAKVQHGIEIAIVDYIGRMDMMNLKDAKEWQILKSAAQRLKTIATAEGIAIIMVAQLTADGGRLAQSSYMTHEADLWMNISAISQENLAQSYPWNYVLSFRKARNVEKGATVSLYFHGDTLTFTDKREEAERMAGTRPIDNGLTTENVREEDLPL